MSHGHSEIDYVKLSPSAYHHTVNPSNSSVYKTAIKMYKTWTFLLTYNWQQNKGIKAKQVMAIISQ